MNNVNVVCGNVLLNQSGEAVIQLPLEFTTKSTDLTYNLTCIKEHSPVYVHEGIKCFTIKGGKANTRVSWQVTGRSK